ncbi:MAG: hypothetical protein HY231_17180 [Acidobacteria bacterium]|nr:hypothetical protein [Acidobacteriota bacterium]
MQLHHPNVQNQLAKQEAHLLVVSFAPVQELQDWLPFFQKYYVEKFFREQKLEQPTAVLARTRFVADPELQSYHAYGLGRHSTRQAYGWKIVRRFLRLLWQGKPLRRPNGDTLQKGGDFVINRQGRLTLSHIGRDQSERPTVAEVLAALQK